MTSIFVSSGCRGVSSGETGESLNLPSRALTKLWSAHAAMITLIELSTFNFRERWKISHLAVNMPNAHYTHFRARDSLWLKILFELSRLRAPYGRIRLSFKGYASSPTKQYGVSSPEVPKGMGGGKFNPLFNNAWPNVECLKTAPSLFIPKSPTSIAVNIRSASTIAWSWIEKKFL